MNCTSCPTISPAARNSGWPSPGPWRPSPSLLLADEPTAALDSRTGREVVELLQRLARDQGCAVLMVTHDPRILDVADRLVRMEDGRLVEASLELAGTVSPSEGR